ncbi:hypothetical protein ACLIA0_08890 [Bacillaceae bacterium W0354]
MSYWFLFNLILLLFSFWKVVTHHSFLSLNISVIFGLLGFLLFLFNWTRHAVYSTIRQHPNRRVKIVFAQLSKKVMRFHRWIGSAALIVIIVHGTLIINKYGFYLQHLKMLSGLLALINLFILVTSGWIRFYKPSGLIRKLHLCFGLSLFLLISLHIYL